VSGTIVYDEAAPEKSSVSITIDAASVDSNNPKRDEHLESPDFFSVKEFPTIEFRSKSVARKGDKLEITGDLTLHGVTKSVTATAEVTGAGEVPQQGHKAGFEATLNVKRGDFGMTKYAPGLGDEVRIIVAIEAARKSS
jgi:polyisoprenoid-binding protein YceI